MPVPPANACMPVPRPVPGACLYLRPRPIIGAGHRMLDSACPCGPANDARQCLRPPMAVLWRRSSPLPSPLVDPVRPPCWPPCTAHATVSAPTAPRTSPAGCPAVYWLGVRFELSSEEISYPLEWVSRFCYEAPIHTYVWYGSHTGTLPPACECTHAHLHARCLCP